MSATRAYLRTKVLTASPAELRLMLFDGALRYAEQARRGLADSDFEAAFEGISRCQQIVLELINGLDARRDPELCRRLAGLYTFLYTRLIAASTDRDPAIVEEVIRLLAYERETWAMALARLAGPEPAGGRPQPGSVSVQG